MLASIAFNYWMAIAIAGLKPSATTGEPRARKWLLAFAVGANLLVLGVFKYANFFADNLNSLLVTLQANPVVIPRVLLPIGISFFTFHAISYVVDVYRGGRRRRRRARFTLRSTCCSFRSSLQARSSVTGTSPISLRRGTYRSTTSLMASGGSSSAWPRRCSSLMSWPDRPTRFSGCPQAQLTPSAAWLGIICYTLQIYFDFSGYSDMALGLGRMFGFRFPENFRWPYVAQTVQEFWRRWHISLSAWFRDYLYVPLGGNRTLGGANLSQSGDRVFSVRPVARRQLELRGLGPLSRHVFWSWNGSGLADAHRATCGNRSCGMRTLLVVVMVGWVFFRAETLARAVEFLKAMAGGRAVTPTPYAVQWYLTPELWLALVAGAIGSMPVVPALAKGAMG